MTQPDAIILDIERFLPAFRWYLKPDDNCPEFVSEIVHSIVCCCQDADMAEYELREFAAQVEFGEYEENIAIPIRPLYATPIIELGTEILKSLHDLKLFDAHTKRLQYEYYTHELQGTTDPILRYIGDEQ